MYSNNYVISLLVNGKFCQLFVLAPALLVLQNGLLKSTRTPSHWELYLRTIGIGEIWGDFNYIDAFLLSTNLGRWVERVCVREGRKDHQCSSLVSLVGLIRRWCRWWFLCVQICTSVSDLGVTSCSKSEWKPSMCVVYLSSIIQV